MECWYVIGDGKGLVAALRLADASGSSVRRVVGAGLTILMAAVHSYATSSSTISSHSAFRASRFVDVHAEAGSPGMVSRVKRKYLMEIERR